MKKIKKSKSYTIEELTDEYIGKRGTHKREVFEFELKLDLLGNAIKKVRLQQNLTQEELGNLVGVQKSQISKIENNFTNTRFDTMIKVFDALNAKVNFKIEF